MRDGPTIGVVVNRAKTLGPGLEHFRALLADLGHPDPPWVEVARSRDAPDGIRGLVDAGVDRILTWGGDGTVRRTIDTLVAAGLGSGPDRVELGILPAGTANILARNLGIPIDLRRATGIAVRGRAHPIDVGRCHGEYFGLMVGAGFDAALLKGAEDDGSKERFGQLGQVVSGVRQASFPGAEVVVSVDGREWFRGRATMVLISNVPRTLGGLTAFPDASPTDGVLDVGVSRAEGRLQWLRLAARAAVSRPDASPLAELAAGSRIVAEFARTLPWQIDGGDRGRTDRLEVECLPGALRLVRPEGSP